MNGPSKLTLYLIVAGVAPATGFAQSPEHYVAQVSKVFGTCRECPHGHPEHSHDVSTGTQLAADDDIQCDGRGFLVASYTGSKSYFRIEGTTWQPVGFPGAGGNSNPQQPREGRIAYNSLEEAETGRQFAGSSAHGPTVAQGDSSKNQETANSDLSLTVRLALDKNAVNTRDVKVDVTEGKVILTGSVPQTEQVDKALEVAKSVTGVTSVDNRLLAISVTADAAAAPAAAPAAAAAAAEKGGVAVGGPAIPEAVLKALEGIAVGVTPGN